MAIVPDPGDPRGGAGWRVSNRRMDERFAGDQQWRKMEFDFLVREPVAAANLICEVRAGQGEAWFDEASLQLRRREAVEAPVWSAAR